MESNLERNFTAMARLLAKTNTRAVEIRCFKRDALEIDNGTSIETLELSAEGFSFNNKILNLLGAEELRPVWRGTAAWAVVAYTAQIVINGVPRDIELPIGTRVYSFVFIQHVIGPTPEICI